MALPAHARLPLVLALALVPVTTAGTASHAAPPGPGPVPVRSAPVAAPATGTPGTVEVGEQRAAGLTVRYGSARGGSRQVLRHPGATYIKVHFASLTLAAGDYVTVADPARAEVFTYHGAPGAGRTAGDSPYTVHGRTGFAAMSVEGDTAVVTLHRVSSPTARAGTAARVRPGHGARIDRFWRGFGEAEVAARNPAPLSVCDGGDARRDTVCYQSSHPTEFARSRAVARLLINGSSLCTGWRVGSTNRMLTNNHCVSSQSGISGTEVRFGYECRTCGGNNPGAGTKVSGAQFLRTNSASQLDYTVFSVNDFAAVQQYGTLFLEPRRPTRGERIYIAGHGGGRPKQLSIYEDTGFSRACTVTNPQLNAYNAGYMCDTSGGSSGSPVLAAGSHRVIALHHLGGCPNAGARMELIYPQIQDLVVNQ
jgi:V8-like Glu-specific endopeptidase